MKKILITGFNGFVGQHACKEFRERGFEIHGISKDPVDDETGSIVDRVTICDLANPEETARLHIEEGAVLNLAGFATNTTTDSELVHKINIGAHVNLYDRIRNLGLAPRIIAVSTGLVYDPSQPMPIDETGKIRDPGQARPYESSKVLMERAIQPFIDEGMDIIVARPFNHIGSGQGRGFIVPDFAGQIEQYLTTGKEIETGSLVTERDYTSVDDVVRAYDALIEADSLEHRIYNICSGAPRTGGEILSLLCNEYGIDVPVHHEAKAKVRPNEIVQFYGSSLRISSELNWSSSEDITQTIHEYVVWRRALSGV